MSTTYTQNARFAKPGPADRAWNIPLNANADALDALAPVGGLCVAPTEVPSASLRVQAAPGRFQRRDGTVGVFAGAPAIALAAGAANYVYLDDAGQVHTSTSGFPTTSHVPLAIATAGATSVASVVDLRVVCATVGTDSRPFLTPNGGTLNDGAAFALGTGAGLKVGTSASQKLGFWNATPIARPGPYTQGYAASSRGVPAYTPSPSTSAFPGIAAGQGGTPYAQATDLNALRNSYENLRALAEGSAQVLNALINDLKAMGLLG